MKNKILFLVFILMMASGCSNTAKINDQNSDILSMDDTEENPFFVYDPIEPFNKRVYTFNYYLDKYLFIPTVKGYKFITPDPVERRVTSFFNNIGEPKNVINSALQGEGKRSLKSLNRFVINSVFGVFGIFDVASHVGLGEHREDFGNTLAKYGVPEGPFLIVPVLGPSNARDLTGQGVDALTRLAISPVEIYGFENAELELLLLQGIDLRSQINFTYYQTGSPFEYEYLRYFYTKLRRIKGGTLKRYDDEVSGQEM